MPYDERFEDLFLAYIVGLTVLGLGVRVAFTEFGPHRLGTIINLIEKADYSIHDLSRIESTDGIPRFNMPLELGLCLHRSHATRRNMYPHRVYLFESMPFRAQRSTSDLNGMDPHIHRNTAEGVMQCLRNLFSQPGRRITVDQLMAKYQDVGRKLPLLRKKAGGGSLFEKALFEDLLLAASASGNSKRSGPSRA